MSVGNILETLNEMETQIKERIVVFANLKNSFNQSKIKIDELIKSISLQLSTENKNLQDFLKDINSYFLSSGDTVSKLSKQSDINSSLMEEIQKILK